LDVRSRGNPPISFCDSACESVCFHISKEKRMKALLIILTAMLASCPTAAQATAITYTAILNGPSEAPPNTSPATGAATVIFDDVSFTLEVKADFAGLLGTTTASHIHCCTATSGTGTAGVATLLPAFPDFPLGVTSGSFDSVLNLLSASAYNPAFVTANGGSVALAEMTLVNSLAAGTTYFNIHTTSFPGGEIRGFLQPVATAVPEPATWSLVAIGALVGARRWRSRARNRE
jgi:hypothetical protein